MLMRQKIMHLKMGFIPLAAVVVVIAFTLVTAVPVVADEWYQNINFSGPASGSVGDTLTYTYSGQHCTGLNPNNPPPPNPNAPSGGGAQCGPISGNVHFLISKLNGPLVFSQDISVDNTGAAVLEYKFTEAGQYDIRANVQMGNTEYLRGVITTVQSKPSTPSIGAPSVGTPSDGGSNSDSGSGSLSDSSASEQPSEESVQNATAMSVPDVITSVSAASNPLWTLLIGIGIIVLLAIIAAVLLLRRRGEEEPYEEREYGRSRRHRRR